VFSLGELISSFSLEKVSKAGARFDFNKARWFNQQHLRLRPKKDLLKEYLELLKKTTGRIPEKDWAEKSLDLFMDRAEFIKDIISESTYLFEDPQSYDNKVVAKKWNSEAHNLINDLKGLFSKTNYTSESLESCFKEYLSSSSLSFGQVGPVLRLAVAGTTQGPSIFMVMELIGRESTERRMDSALIKLG
jgi:glutamyl-tRNA synthetase